MWRDHRTGRVTGFIFHVRVRLKTVDIEKLSFGSVNKPRGKTRGEGVAQMTTTVITTV